MNFFKKLFGSANTTAQQNQSREEYVKQVQENANKLWDFLGETLAFYHSKSCQCAFPRFRQIVSIDCTDTGTSFYCSETEGFISHAKKYFTVSKTDTGTEAYNESWSCNKCGLYMIMAGQISVYM
ncbi:MAG: hypothetical protein WDO16_16675 [Bacteroidota bacterium]